MSTVTVCRGLSSFCGTAEELVWIVDCGGWWCGGAVVRGGTAEVQNGGKMRSYLEQKQKQKSKTKKPQTNLQPSSKPTSRVPS